MRDHLFISYAGEDAAFVDWLSLRLVGEGYKVWWDRDKLLGGESYPRDIDEAIKNRTFRLISVLSQHSLAKPNPLKERTLALNLARERGEDFVIPINLDGVSPTDLNWMVSDLTFVPFHHGWREGLSQLLRKLEQLQAPKGDDDGRALIRGWFETNDLVVAKEEQLWSNVVEILALPRDIYRYEAETEVSEEQKLELLKYWPFFDDGLIFWSFEHPPVDFSLKYELKERGRSSDWETARTWGVNVRNVAVRLFNASFRHLCLSRGLRITADRDLCYFPDGLVPENWLPFTQYDGRRTRVKAVGVRNFRTLSGPQPFRYHLAPVFRIWLDRWILRAVQVRVRLFMTSLDGTRLGPKPALRRRKSICKWWWNDEWLSRTLATLQFLADGRPSIEIGKVEGHRIAVSLQPISFKSDYGLDESKLEHTDALSESEEAIIEPDGEEEEGAVNE